MKKASIQEAIAQIVQTHPRFDRDAYFFVRDALDHTLRMLKREEASAEGRRSPESIKQPPAHVSGQELLEGIRGFALQEYGPLAKTVLEHWGVTRCEDFGEIVFHMVEHGVLGKTEQDSQADFAGGYSFEDAFVKPFRRGFEENSTADQADGRG